VIGGETAETQPGRKQMIMERLLLSPEQVAESLGCAIPGSMT
jgi:hypothetical protein